MSCECHRIQISMVCMWFIWILGLMNILDLGFEVEMQYDLFLRIEC